ncbi:hypothetical protein HDU85_003967 [Gaertneriomyces sp. JEL0708]|nr:hypothetical protein HDU85_003967 [Gaertneriomyces sp. JEL0708]
MPTSQVAPGPQVHFTPTPSETAQKQAQAQAPEQGPGPSSSAEQPTTPPQHPQQPEHQDNPGPHPQEEQHSPHQPTALYDPDFTFPPSAKKPGKLRRKMSTWRYAVRDYMGRIWRECKDPASWLEERDDSFSMQ